MDQKGFGLIGILFVVAIIALLAGGGLYINKLGEQKSQIQIGIDAEKQAEVVKKQIEAKSKQLQESINQNLPNTSGSSTTNLK